VKIRTDSLSNIRGPFIVRFVDAHGLVRIVGTDKFGIEMDYESMNASEMGGKEEQ